MVRTVLIVVLLGLPRLAHADQEAPNTPHIATDEYGRCYARSVPEYDYDPSGQPRQQGATTTYYVTEKGDIPVDTYDWYSHSLLVTCTLGGSGRSSGDGTPLPLIRIVRFGPWHRLPPEKDHLAIAFYEGGKLLKAFTTFDIAGGGKPPKKCGRAYENMSYSVSHYMVFGGRDKAAFGSFKLNDSDGERFVPSLSLVTVDGRRLTFRMDTGELVKSEKVSEEELGPIRLAPC